MLHIKIINNHFYRLSITSLEYGIEGILFLVGAFLIPYFLFLFIIGMPMVFLEFSYSQFANLGPGRIWIICPLFKGKVLTGLVNIGNCFESYLGFYIFQLDFIRYAFT